MERPDGVQRRRRRAEQGAVAAAVAAAAVAAAAVAALAAALAAAADAVGRRRTAQCVAQTLQYVPGEFFLCQSRSQDEYSTRFSSSSEIF